VYQCVIGPRILQEDEDKIVGEITIPKNSNILEFEEQFQGRLSEAGRTVTERALADFDTDGFPFFFGNTKFTAKRKRVAKKYETPSGAVQVERFAYRSSGGGRTHIPFEQNARIIGNATPRLAKLISSKYSHSNAGVVQEDLRETLHREVSRCFIRDLLALMAERIGEKSPPLGRRWRRTFPGAGRHRRRRSRRNQPALLRRRLPPSSSKSPKNGKLAKPTSRPQKPTQSAKPTR